MPTMLLVADESWKAHPPTELHSVVRKHMRRYSEQLTYIHSVCSDGPTPNDPFKCASEDSGAYAGCMKGVSA